MAACENCLEGLPSNIVVFPLTRNFLTIKTYWENNFMCEITFVVYKILSFYLHLKVKRLFCYALCYSTNTAQFKEQQLKVDSSKSDEEFQFQSLFIHYVNINIIEIAINFINYNFVIENIKQWFLS